MPLVFNGSLQNQYENSKSEVYDTEPTLHIYIFFFFLLNTFTIVFKTKSPKHYQSRNIKTTSSTKVKTSGYISLALDPG